MSKDGIWVDHVPELKNPLLIAGFDGWGNAMNIATGMVDHMIRTFQARAFARLNADVFYRYDENRPYVHIDVGKIIRVSPPGGSFYAARDASDQKDLVLLSADEPNLNWYRFTEDLTSFCRRLGIDTVIFLGSMYDNVLHTDRIVSGIASNDALSSWLKAKNIPSVSYHGPGAIHSVLITETGKKGLQSISLWAHSPFYLQGATHYGLMSHLGSLLSSLGEFALETAGLESKWETLKDQILTLINRTPELQAVIDKLQKDKVRGSWDRIKNLSVQHDNVINLKDFLD